MAIDLLVDDIIDLYRVFQRIHKILNFFIHDSSLRDSTVRSGMREYFQLLNSFIIESLERNVNWK